MWVSNLRPAILCRKQLRSHAHSAIATVRDDERVKVTALAGGVGAGKFLRGLVRAVPPWAVTVVVNTGDDMAVHGLHVSPDLDSVTYWLAGVADRERGWGRAGETFRLTEELRRLGAEGSWFGLGDLDLATHLIRTKLLSAGATLTEATAAVTERFALEVRILPMSDQPVATRVDVIADPEGPLDLHFQEYWVKRAARDQVKAVRYEGAQEARATDAVMAALTEADAIVICPSNPVASIDPILAVPGVLPTLRRRRDVVVAVSPIVGGRPLRGMADKLLPSVGVEVSAEGVAHHYRDIIGAFVMDDVDKERAVEVRRLLGGRPVRVLDTIMVDDAAAERVARACLSAWDDRDGSPRVEQGPP
jgi:LPPG:FO 2-phospho-L-lactate transferase